MQPLSATDKIKAKEWLHNERLAKGYTNIPLGSESPQIQFGRLQGLITPKQAEDNQTRTQAAIDDLQMHSALKVMGLPVDDDNFVDDVLFALTPIQTPSGSYTNFDGIKVVQIHAGMFDAILAICRYVPTEVKRDFSFNDMSDDNAFLLNHLYFIASRWQVFSGAVWSDLEFSYRLPERSTTRSERIYKAVCSFIIGHELSHARKDEIYSSTDKRFNHAIELAADRLGLEYAAKLCVTAIVGGEKNDILPYIFLAPYIALALISLIGSSKQTIKHPSLERRIANIDTAIEGYYERIYNPGKSQAKSVYLKEVLKGVRYAGRRLIIRFSIIRKSSLI